MCIFKSEIYIHTDTNTNLVWCLLRICSAFQLTMHCRMISWGSSHLGTQLSLLAQGFSTSEKLAFVYCSLLSCALCYCQFAFYIYLFLYICNVLKDIIHFILNNIYGGLHFKLWRRMSNRELSVLLEERVRVPWKYFIKSLTLGQVFRDEDAGQTRGWRGYHADGRVRTKAQAITRHSFFHRTSSRTTWIQVVGENQKRGS